MQVNCVKVFNKVDRTQNSIDSDIEHYPTKTSIDDFLRAVKSLHQFPNCPLAMTLSAQR